MSKKNNLSTRKRKHEFALKKEQEIQAKQASKAAKKAAKDSNEMKDTNMKKKKIKKIRLKKNAIIRGIRIKTAEDRQRVMELLEAEKLAEDMEFE